MTSNASPNRSLSVLNRSTGAMRSSLNRRPIAHNPSLAARRSTIFNSASERPGSRRCFGVNGSGSDWLTQHRREHAVVDRGREREAAGEALADHPDALARRLFVEVAGERPQIVRDGPVSIGGERSEFLCDTATQHYWHHPRPDRLRARCAEHRRRGHRKPVVHQVITEREHARMKPRHLGDQHHAGTRALAIDVVGEAGGSERLGGPSGQVGFRHGHDVSVRNREGPAVPYLAGSGEAFCVAAASVRYSSVPAPPLSATCASPVGPLSRVVHTGSALSALS